MTNEEKQKYVRPALEEIPLIGILASDSKWEGMNDTDEEDDAG